MNSPASSAPPDPALAEALRLGRAGEWAAAAQAFRRLHIASPGHHIALQGLLECARALVVAGQRAPTAELRRPVALPRISFVVCSITPRKLEALRADIARRFAGFDWELIAITDARSLAEGYTRGLARARGEVLVFCHDDIGFLDDEVALRLCAHLQRHDLVGVAGADRAAGPTWFWAGPPHTSTWISMPQPDGALVCGLLGLHGGVLPGAQTLDGVLLAGRREVFEGIGFDADTFDGFHLYDLDFSYRAHLGGWRCAVAADLLLWHESGGHYGADWSKYADRFLAKFPPLRPQQTQAAFRPGTLRLAEPRLAPAVYAWVAHWCGAPDSGS